MRPSFAVLLVALVLPGLARSADSDLIPPSALLSIEARGVTSFDVAWSGDRYLVAYAKEGAIHVGSVDAEGRRFERADAIEVGGDVFVALATNGSSGLLAWSQRHPVPRLDAVYLDAAGRVAGNVWTVSTCPEWCSRPEIDDGPNGDFFMVWSQSPDPADSDRCREMWGQVFRRTPRAPARMGTASCHAKGIWSLDVGGSAHGWMTFFTTEFGAVAIGVSADGTTVGHFGLPFDGYEVESRTLASDDAGTFLVSKGNIAGTPQAVLFDTAGVRATPTLAVHTGDEWYGASATFDGEHFVVVSQRDLWSYARRYVSLVSRSGTSFTRHRGIQLSNVSRLESDGKGGVLAWYVSSGGALSFAQIPRGDGIPDESDNCPGDWNPDQADLDGDGWGDACDDSDRDLLGDSTDNCPLLVNEQQEDHDSDHVGDACDPDLDSDGDGFVQPLDNCVWTANPDQADMDLDGIGDVCDSDADGDGFDRWEDPCPLDPGVTDTDGDTYPDACDGDADNDGRANLEDNCPLVPNWGQEDLDHDGQGDACDAYAPPRVWVAELPGPGVPVGAKVASEWSPAEGSCAVADVRDRSTWPLLLMPFALAWWMRRRAV